MITVLSQRRVLFVGVGGLGCPAARALARSGVGHIALVDDDVVSESNLQRQVLYHSGDVKRPKVLVAAEVLRREAAEAGHGIEVVARENRVLPDRAIELVGSYDLVLEGVDNFASKFLVADACALARVPVVQAGAIRWAGWALCSVPGQGACLRCVFEDLPRGEQDTCATAGVLGPVVGALGALQAAIAIRLLSGDRSAAGALFRYDGLAGTVRQHPVQRQSHCPLCNGRITDTHVSRYAPPECAA
jgi:adenylyltransferase/sulfurtransferase